MLKKLLKGLFVIALGYVTCFVLANFADCKRVYLIIRDTITYELSQYDVNFEEKSDSAILYFSIGDEIDFNEYFYAYYVKDGEEVAYDLNDSSICGTEISTFETGIYEIQFTFEDGGEKSNRFFQSSVYIIMITDNSEAKS